jgi:predicted site-specific integrase-resolvase
MAAYLNNALRRVILFPNSITSEKNISILPNRNAKIIFHTDTNSVICKMNTKILQAALNIISNQEKTSEFDHMRHRVQQNHKEYLQKFTENSNSIDKIQNTMDENCKKLEKIEENLGLFQTKVDRNHTNLDTNIKKLKEECQLQLAHSQKTLQEKLDQYEYRLSWIQQSQKQTTDLLTDILSVLNSGNDKSTFGNTTSAM